MWKNFFHQHKLFMARYYSRVSPPPRVCDELVIRVSSSNIAHLGPPRDGPKPRQLLSLPPFPDHSLPGKNLVSTTHVTAISWMKYYFDEIPGSVIQTHFNKGLVHMDDSDSNALSSMKEGVTNPLRKIKHNEVMKAGVRVYVPVSVAETKISKRFDSIPSGTLYPNADEIEYLQRLVKYKDSAIIVLNKPPKLPVKGSLPVHNSMDALAAAALSYDYDEGPKLVLLNDGKTERVMLAHGSGLEASQEAVTEYRVLGPMINGCSWIELRPITSRKHQIRVHCAEALGTPIVGDYKYGWFVHRKWKQMPRVDFEPTTGKPYKLRRPEGLDVQKGSVLSKVPLLHMHCRELVLPNIAKFIEPYNHKSESRDKNLKHNSKQDLLRFVASMPSHMKISWNLMSSFLV